MADERWALVTGASSGIGRATALALADAGWNVVIHYRASAGAAQSLADEVTGKGPRSLLASADLRDPDAGPALIEEAWGMTGGLSACVLNAGADVLTGPAAQLTFRRKFEELVAVDLWGTMATARAAGQKMRERGSGTIVTIGWDQADTGMEGDSGELFAAVKGAVMSFTRSLAKSLAPAVRVHCVAPGWIRTAWGEKAGDVWQERVKRETLLQRWGHPEDIADACVFLVSDQARFLTGQTLYVNGGAVTS